MGPPELAVGAIVIHDGALLMVRRGRDPGRGLWSIPGGRVERGEYLSDALAREVREETGVEIEVDAFAGFFEVVGEDHFVVLDFVAHSAERVEPRAAGDAQDARWVPLEDIASLECTPRFVQLLTAWGILASADEEGD